MHGWEPWCSRRWFARRFGVDIMRRGWARTQSALIEIGRDFGQKAWQGKRDYPRIEPAMAENSRRVPTLDYGLLWPDLLDPS